MLRNDVDPLQLALAVVPLAAVTSDVSDDRFSIKSDINHPSQQCFLRMVCAVHVLCHARVSRSGRRIQKSRTVIAGMSAIVGEVALQLKAKRGSTFPVRARQSSRRLPRVQRRQPHRLLCRM
jgi:hypothetical protein